MATKQNALLEARGNANEQKSSYFVFETVHGYGALSFRPVEHVGGSALLSDVIEVEPTKTVEQLTKEYVRATFKIRRAVNAEEIEAGKYGEIVENVTVAIGDGVNERCYSDIHSWTVIAMSPSAKTLTIQRDKATRIDDPEFVAGGFSAHCTNNRALKYDIEPDTDGETTKARLRNDGSYWTTGGRRIEPGRFEFYDYNF